MENPREIKRDFINYLKVVRKERFIKFKCRDIGWKIQ